jgi:hypothetical protein
METKAFGIQSPESLAKEYGGNKQKIARAVQLGILDPTAAVLAGMFIDRVRNAAQEEQGPQTTVAQQVLGGQPPAPPQGPPPQAGLQAAAPPAMRMAYGGQVGISNNQVPSPAMERGLDGIPIPDNMFDYAGGGMIAFADGGDVKRFNPGGAAILQPKVVSSYPYNPVYAAPPPQQIINPNALLEYPTRPGGPAIFGSGADPTGYKYFNRDISKLAPYLSELEIERLYQRFAGNVSKAVNFLKSLGPAAGAGIASMAVEEATGKSPDQQMMRGIRAINPFMGAMVSGLEQLGIVKPSLYAAGTIPFTDKQKEDALKNAVGMFGDRTELRASPGRGGVVAGTGPQLVDAQGRRIDQTGALITPEATTDAAKRDEEIKRANDVAAQTARQIMAPVSIAAPTKPEKRKVPELADLDMEIEAARPRAQSMYSMPPEADKSLNQIIESDRETLTKQGYDFNLIKNMVAETRAEREKIPEQRKEAASLRLLEAGLAIMGGTSPYAFVNIGKGGSEAAKGFNEDMKEFRKLDREYRKELQQLQSMQNQETLMLTTEGKKRYERIQDKVRDTADKRAKAQFDMGQEVFRRSVEDRRIAEAANDAIDRSVYQTEAQTNIAQAQIKAQQNVAGASTRLAQEEKDRYINSWLARPENKGKDYSAAVDAYNVSRLGIAARGQLSPDEAIKQATTYLNSPGGLMAKAELYKQAQANNQKPPSDEELIRAYARKLMQINPGSESSSTTPGRSAADSIVFGRQ